MLLDLEFAARADPYRRHVTFRKYFTSPWSSSSLAVCARVVCECACVCVCVRVCVCCALCGVRACVQVSTASAGNLGVGVRVCACVRACGGSCGSDCATVRLFVLTVQL